jgi:hypothetical protein
MKPAPSLASSLEHRLSGYALAASAAGVGALALAQSAEAKIVYRPETIVIAQPDCVFFNPAGNPSAPFCFVAIFTAPGSSIWGAEVTIGLETADAGFVAAGHNSASALKRGNLIGPSDQFQNSGFGYLATSGPFFGGTSKHHRGGFQFGRSAYLGIRFKVGGQKHYGWARVTVYREENGVGFYLYALTSGYAYETIPNKPIIAGKTHGKDVVTIQDPSLGHLARGASGLSAWRRTNSVAASH